MVLRVQFCAQYDRDRNPQTASQIETLRVGAQDQVIPGDFKRIGHKRMDLQYIVGARRRRALSGGAVTVRVIG